MVENYYRIRCPKQRETVGITKDAKIAEKLSKDGYIITHKLVQ